MKKILIIGAKPKSLINFRGELIEMLGNYGYEVTGMASHHDELISEKLESINSKLITYPVRRNGLNPFHDLSTFLSLRKTFRTLNPTVILSYTIKPVIWGGLASRALPETKFYALISGLGYAFEGDSLKRRLITLVASNLYKFSLRKAKKVIFQNPDNLSRFLKLKIVRSDQCCLIRGSGINLKYFNQTSLPSLESGSIVFLSIGRLLGEKGFREYASAAMKVKEKYPNAIFQLLGATDSSPDGIKMSEVSSWVESGLIDYLGTTNDVRPYLKCCHVFVLCSYHEGVPRTTLEAMSVGRPILTTDTPGCKETVIDAHNGYLVPKQDSEALAKKMIWFIENSGKLKLMGSFSRELAENHFDVNKINKKFIELIDE